MKNTSKNDFFKEQVEMEEGLVVLSLFDGISCGQLALKKAAIKTKKYFASEIEKEPISITQKYFPETIQLGNVVDIYYKDGVLYTSNGEFEVGKIDLLIGGSPCTDVSAANIGGKGLEGEKSSLFYEYVRILKEVKPKYFLLENAGTMKSNDIEIVNESLGADPFLINSSNFVPQNRLRNYWTNINFGKIFPIESSVSSILENEVDNCYYLNSEKHFFIKGSSKGKSYLKFLGGIKTKNVNTWLDDGKHYSRNFKQGYRVYNKTGHAPTLTASGGGLSGKTGLIYIGNDKENIKVEDIRRLTPLEAERLQGLPDNYTNTISKSHRLKAIGNGWTVDVVAHILKGLK